MVAPHRNDDGDDNDGDGDDDDRASRAPRR